MNPVNPVNISPYLRTSRQWPTDIGNLVVELNTMYNDVSTNLNLRTIGLYPTIKPAITGDSWYITQAMRQQSIRQVYTLPGPVSVTTTLIPHFITPNSYTNIVRMWGTFQDANGLWDVLPYVDAAAGNNQIKLQLDATNIIITRGTGAGTPIINNLVVVIEWLANI